MQNTYCGTIFTKKGQLYNFHDTSQLYYQGLTDASLIGMSSKTLEHQLDETWKLFQVKRRSNLRGGQAKSVMIIQSHAE